MVAFIDAFLVFITFCIGSLSLLVGVKTLWSLERHMKDYYEERILKQEQFTVDIFKFCLGMLDNNESKFKTSFKNLHILLKGGNLNKEDEDAFDILVSDNYHKNFGLNKKSITEFIEICKKYGVNTLL